MVSLMFVAINKRNTSKTHVIILSAKVWGDAGGEPVLAVHGIGDNAAAFDTLVPLVLQFVGRPLYVVCVDLPGHGHSSPLAPGVLYRFTDMLGCLYRVVSQLGWQRFHYLGHSLGALLGLYFVASYPNLVEKLIVIDVITFTLYPTRYHSNLLRAYGEKLLASEKNDRPGTNLPSSYTLDQALHKLAQGRGTKMTEAGVKALASRSLRPVEGHDNLYKFLTRDKRMKFFVFPVIGVEEAVQMMSQVKCQLLIVTGNESLRAEKGSLNATVLNVIAKHCSYLKHHVVNGDHDVHLNFPERIAPLVARFLCNMMSSL
jgi:pimeloyl-ACP methyl ester carboxylesterase